MIQPIEIRNYLGADIWDRLVKNSNNSNNQLNINPQYSTERLQNDDLNEVYLKYDKPNINNQSPSIWNKLSSQIGKQANKFNNEANQLSKQANILKEQAIDYNKQVNMGMKNLYE